MKDEQGNTFDLKALEEKIREAIGTIEIPIELVMPEITIATIDISAFGDLERRKRRYTPGCITFHLVASGGGNDENELQLLVPS